MATVPHDNFTRFTNSWLEQVSNDRELTPTAFYVAYRISRFFNRQRYIETGACIAWPSYETLAEEAGCTGKTIQRMVGKLSQRGHLQTVGMGGRRRTLTYFACLKRDSEKASSVSPGQPKGGHASPPFSESDVDENEKVDNRSPESGHLKTEKVDRNVLQTSMNKISDKIFDAKHGDLDRSPARGPAAVIVLSILLEDTPRPVRLPPFVKGKEKQFPKIVLNAQAEQGWPDLDSQCQEPWRWNSGLATLAFEMVPVAIDSTLWLAWKAEYRSRGWPMPEPLDGIACFPPGGPKKFEAFLGRVKQGVVETAPSNVVRFAS